MVIRGHFDGKNIVPDGPVNLRKGESVQIYVVPEAEAGRPLSGLGKLAESLPVDPSWPKDGAAQHDHLLYGTPKKAG